MPDWATSTDRSTAARIVGSFVSTCARLENGSAALTRSWALAASAATSSTLPGVNPATSRIARHCASSGWDAAPATRSSAAMTIGPRVVKLPPASLPVSASRSPTHHGSAGSGRHTPVIATSRVRDSSRRETRWSVSPAPTPSAAAAPSDSVPSTGFAPGVGHAPSTRVAWSSIPS